MRSWVALAVVLLVAVGCGEEEPPYHDGSESSVVAGAATSLETTPQ